MQKALFTLILAAATTAASAEDIKAGKDAVLRRDKSSMSPVEATVKKGASIPVLERSAERNVKWIRSEVDGKQGWVTESDLKSSGGFDLGKMSAAISGDAQADAAGEAAAAKGVEPLTLNYSKSQGYDSSGLDRLMALRAKIVDSGEFEQFAKEGNVGAYRK